jgi:hypothetical protein
VAKNSERRSGILNILAGILRIGFSGKVKKLAGLQDMYASKALPILAQAPLKSKVCGLAKHEE